MLSGPQPGSGSALKFGNVAVRLGGVDRIRTKNVACRDTAKERLGGNPDELTAFGRLKCRDFD